MLNDVEPTPIPYWQSSGWERSQPKEGIEVFKGKYKVTSSGEQRGYHGFVVVETSPSYSIEGLSIDGQTTARVFIEDPPKELKNHPNGSCLGLVSRVNEKHKDQFTLHFTVPPRDADSAIRFMEGMLDESFHPQSKKP